MPNCLKTTVIGSYPKPEYLNLPDWFKDDWQNAAHRYNDFIDNIDAKQLDEILEKATKEVVEEQTDLGIDVVTDGEIPRDVYFNHFLRSIDGVDVINLEEYKLRPTCTMDVPVIRGRMRWNKSKSTASKEWRRSTACTAATIKYTLPGPMTTVKSCKLVLKEDGGHYDSSEEAQLDIVDCITEQLQDLIMTGCVNIQIDDPYLMRDTDAAIRYGIRNLSRCIADLPTSVYTTLHVCCGYTNVVNQVNYKKSDKIGYIQMAKMINESGFSAISLEDALSHNPLEVFKLYNNLDLVLGVFRVQQTDVVETVEEIRDRVKQVLAVVPRNRLILAPDCGLGFLPRELVRTKLKNMVEVAKTV